MYRRILILSFTALMATSAWGQSARLLPAGEDDFRVRGATLQVTQNTVRPQGPRGEPASVFMPGRDDGTGTLAMAAPANDSRSYSLQVSARELADGVRLPLTARGAVVQLSPANGRGRVPAAADVTVRQGGWRLQGRNAARDLASPEDMARAAPVFGNDTLAMRLSDRVGAGEAVLSVRRGAVSRRGTYWVHVFEPDSPVTGRVKAERPLVSLGGGFDAEARLAGLEDVRVGRVEAVLRAPDGQTYPAPMSVDEQGEVTGTLQLPRVASSQPGLWELEARLHGEGRQGPVRRDVRVAFAGITPTARLDGRVGVANERDGWRLRVGVTVGSPGRYEVRATLPGTGTAHSARWLDAGRQELVLEFPGRLPEDVTLRNLRLTDQSRVSVLHAQSEGVRIQSGDRRRPAPRLPGRGL